MKTHITFKLLILLTSIGLLSGCDKHRAKKLSGTYSCKVAYHYWDMTPSTSDSTYQEDLEIKQNGKNVIVLGTSIPIDSLWKEKEYYEGNAHNYIEVLFKKDSIYITRSSGGLGGNASWKYRGSKK
ncbi:hypothetical protein [Fluviicola sp.]|uniref:hypothetical protein n=1 Tax=Fluviicola sp. TaxID=1917219 RepID=UPI00260418BA|nr:hypothetical protein [Fluviicola sp.]